MTNTEKPRIVTRCPACGHQSLFVSEGGRLTCSWVECACPGVAMAIDNLRAERDRARAAFVAHAVQCPQCHDAIADALIEERAK